jgi:DNA-binding response OmpR family regulator
VASILVVDDEKSFRDFIETILQADGHHVVTVGSAIEALRLCRKRHFDLITTDLVMPEMDGLELIRALRVTGHGTPVLIISGITRQVLPVAKLLRAEVLSKPFDFVELLAAIDSCLGTRLPAEVLPKSPTRTKQRLNKDV